MGESNSWTKIFSGRYLVLVMLTTTYCIIMIGCLYLAAVGKVPMDFFQGLVTGGLGATLMAVWKDYSTRTDRDVSDKTSVTVEQPKTDKLKEEVK